MSKGDEHGQPSNLSFNRGRRTERDLSELLGLCKGLVADGRVNKSEAEFLEGWLRHSPEAKDEWPGDLLYLRVQEMLLDGQFDDEEERALLDLLIKATGGNASKLNAAALTTGLPLTQPAPALEFSGRQYCFTGKFLLGPRKVCEKEVLVRGGQIREDVTRDLDYLVIGVIGSRDWAHSSFGRKIEKAVTLQRDGVPVAVVSEQSFSIALR